MSTCAATISEAITRSLAKVNLFVYGTLMDRSVIHRLTGKDFPASPAILKDFIKLSSHLGYPYIISDKGSKVEGSIIKNIDRQSMRKLDAYEAKGRLYYREKVRVIAAGEELNCEAYVGNPKFLHPRP